MSDQGSRGPRDVLMHSSSQKPIRTETDAERSNEEQNQLRLVLLGKTGAGKSASGDTILGEKRFDSEECKRECGTVEGRNLLLVDTPGLFDTDEMIHCLALCSPGPHVFLLVIPIERYTEEQQRSVEMFREDIANRTIIVFTHADRLDGSIEDFISRQNDNLQDLVEMFGNRYVGFDNTDPGNRNQVVRLLEMVDQLQVQNENTHFTNQMTEVMLRAETIINERAPSYIRAVVKKLADDRWDAFTAEMKEERRDSEKKNKHLQLRIEQIETDIKNEERNEKPIPERLERLKELLKIDRIIYRRFEEERVKDEMMQTNRMQRERIHLDMWTNEERKRRESEKKNKDDSILTALTSFLLGVDRSKFAPLLLSFLFPDAPVVEDAGTVVQILDKLLNSPKGGVYILPADLSQLAHHAVIHV